MQKTSCPINLRSPLLSSCHAGRCFSSSFNTQPSRAAPRSALAALLPDVAADVDRPAAEEHNQIAVVARAVEIHPARGSLLLGHRRELRGGVHGDVFDLDSAVHVVGEALSRRFELALLFGGEKRVHEGGAVEDEQRRLRQGERAHGCAIFHAEALELCALVVPVSVVSFTWTL